MLLEPKIGALIACCKQDKIYILFAITKKFKKFVLPTFDITLKNHRLQLHKELQGIGLNQFEIKKKLVSDEFYYNTRNGLLHYNLDLYLVVSNCSVDSSKLVDRQYLGFQWVSYSRALGYIKEYKKLEDVFIRLPLKLNCFRSL